MHLYLMTRGIMETRNRWVDFMKTRMLPWKRKNLASNQWETKMIGLALRPVELWEVVIPEDCLMEVLAMQHKANGSDSLITSTEIRAEIKNYAELMQKLLKLKPIPKFDKPTVFGYRTEEKGEILPVNWVPLDGFAVYPIGIKEDIFQEYPNFIEPNAPKGFYQEGI